MPHREVSFSRRFTVYNDIVRPVVSVGISGRAVDDQSGRGSAVARAGG
jgi:hypothetical protein